jgi:NAD(P)-dependent dehydrogenase (short-subunit alcohol dehydrogenase family)
MEGSPGQNANTLRGKTMIVTGSAAGIGRGIAIAALRAGASVTINSRSDARLSTALAEIQADGAILGASGWPVEGVAGDLRRDGVAERLIERTRERFGRVDVLVNNAGGTFHSSAEEITPNGFRAVVDSNLTIAFLCARAAFPVMSTQASGGVIINIASTAPYTSYTGGAHYAAAKAGVMALTRALAGDWGSYGIRSHCLAVGNVLTEQSSFADDEVRHNVEQWTPRGEIGRPEEIAELVVMLAGLEGSYLTGETIRIDGGAAQVPYRKRARARRREEIR